MEQWLEILKFLVLGLIQGVTEPIPVSSSGHLLIFYHFFGLGIEGNSSLGFAVLVNFASLLSVLIIYRKDLARLGANSISYLKDRNPEQKADFRFILFIILGSVPAAVLGLLFNDVIEEELTGVKMIGISLFVTAIALWVIRNLRGRKNDGELSVKDALLIGLGQACALIPGISRSGATIVVAMLIGLQRETALRYSFLLYIPVSLGGMILEGEAIMQIMSDPDMFLPYLVAFIAALVASYFALKWFMHVMKQGNLVIFSVYCLAVSVLIFIFA
ncbi:undecaprenyl-diphosphate phosphatase [Desmospora activa]|uniref:undecaprenyl-diphosphate phosphatase n=1 Tax=Desmospora activa TaxID=500615 RepID=UPI000D2FF976|nr:undecaprenyl-diphosphate phosphatase [Desmospora activa]